MRSYWPPRNFSKPIPLTDGRKQCFVHLKKSDLTGEYEPTFSVFTRNMECLVSFDPEEFENFSKYLDRISDYFDIWTKKLEISTQKSSSKKQKQLISQKLDSLVE
jgi:hypothetical protein